MSRSAVERLRRSLPRWSRRWLIAAGLVTVLLAGLVGALAWPAAPGFTAHEQLLTVRSGPDGATPVTLDTTLYLPDGASA
ncbi:MAG: hypothetical protein ACRDT2_22660, partial [Natronosporangium sp.]